MLKEKLEEQAQTNKKGLVDSIIADARATLLRAAYRRYEIWKDTSFRPARRTARMLTKQKKKKQRKKTRKRKRKPTTSSKPGRKSRKAKRRRGIFALLVWGE